ncbi:MAG: alpha/beta hydrolase fold domain-containing protein [Acidobacteriota bacterium]
MSPKHPFPAAVEDVCDALAWVSRNIESYGGDPSRLIFVQECPPCPWVPPYISLTFLTAWSNMFTSRILLNGIG